MSVRYCILAWLLLMLPACFLTKNTRNSSTCVFDRDNLTVIGSDKVDYDCLTPLNTSSWSVCWLMNVSYINGYFIRDPYSKNIADNIDFKICHCKDTAWAKQQILQEVARQFPYKVVDTFLHTKFYDIYVRDSSNMTPVFYDDIYYGGYANLGDKTRVVNTTYYSIIIFKTMREFKENQGTVSVELGKFEPEYMLEKLYDIIYPRKYLFDPSGTEAEYIAYMRDSMGVDIILAREEFKPIKLIMFDEPKNQLMDSVCVKKYYEIRLVDSSLLQKSMYESLVLGGKISSYINDSILYYGMEYKNIGNTIVPKPFLTNTCHQSVAIMLDTLPGRYDLKVFPNVAKSIKKQEAYIKMVRDSLGFEIKWIKDEILPKNKNTHKKK